MPAKGNFSIEDLARELLSEGLSGALGAAGQHARAMYVGLPQGMELGRMTSQIGQLGSYGPTLSDYLVGSPQFSAFLRDAQQQMIDRFPRVLPAGRDASVLYIADAGEVRVDIQFADEVGNFWRRRFGEQPEPVLEAD